MPAAFGPYVQLWPHHLQPQKSITAFKEELSESLRDICEWMLGEVYVHLYMHIDDYIKQRVSVLHHHFHFLLLIKTDFS